ncbi:response regulator [Candidatus Finniella inopinata]|uniref:Response regulator n=1 Tax=Candidatus Finniella inopinata TaxID=1696036 RepID=A0A4Q7DLW7_9PROT|nr:response regulator [Candidatus Finniella inopinata]RZI45756.1 response regulator [Candidatus Finniella inopinata]
MFFLFFYFFYSVSNASDYVVPYTSPPSKKEFRILLVEDILGMGGMGKKFVQTLNDQEDYKITLDWVKNGKDAVDSYKKSISTSFFCCLSEPQVPYDLIVMDIEIPNTHESLAVNPYGGFKTARKIRKLGYKGAMCAVTCYFDQDLFNLKVECPELFTTWGGKIRSCEELKHMLCTSGQRLSSIPHETPIDTPIVSPRVMRPVVINQEVVCKPGRPLTPRPGDLRPPMDERLAQGQYAISTVFVELNTPMQLESGCKDVVLKKTDQFSHDTLSSGRDASEQIEPHNPLSLHQAAIPTTLSAEIKKSNPPIHSPRSARDAVLISPAPSGGGMCFSRKPRRRLYHAPIRISSPPLAMNILINKRDVKLPGYFISRRHFLIARLGYPILEKQKWVQMDPRH